METQKEEWVLYYNGFGVYRPVGLYESAEDAQAHAGIGLPIVWEQTHEDGWIGFPFNGDRSSPFYYTVNKDGRNVFNILTRRDAPKPKGLFSRFAHWVKTAPGDYR